MSALTLWLDNFAPLRSAPTRIYLSGQAVSMIGIWLQQTAMALLVYQLSGGQAFALGISALCSSVPILLFSMFTGGLADRYDRRKLLIGCHLLEIMLTFIIAAMIHTEQVQLSHLFVFAFLMGCVNSVYFPTQQAFLFDLAGLDNIRKLISINSMILNVCRTLGPTLAGYLVAQVGMSAAFWANGFSYWVVIISLLSLHAIPQTRPNASEQATLGQALRHILDTLTLRNIYICCAALTMFGLGTLALLPAVAHGDPQRTGLLLAAAASGSLVYAFFLSPVISHIKRMGLTLSLTLIWMGTWLVVSALTHWLLVQLIALFMFGLATSQAMVTCTSMVQILSPPAMRGRLMGLFSIIGFGLQPLATLIGGYMADRLGVATTIALWGLVAVTIASLLLAQPQWRGWNLAKT
jgi:MFS family permease